MTSSAPAPNLIKDPDHTEASRPISEQAVCKQQGSRRPLIDNAQFTSLREQLRYEWKTLADEWVKREAKASELEEGKKVLMAEMQLELINGFEVESKKMPIAKADMEARASEQYKKYARRMFDARRAANQARMDRDDADRRYWEAVGSEANARAERRGG